MLPDHGADLEGFIFSPLRDDVITLKADEIHGVLTRGIAFGEIVAVRMAPIEGAESSIRLIGLLPPVADQRRASGRPHRLRLRHRGDPPMSGIESTPFVYTSRDYGRLRTDMIGRLKIADPRVGDERVELRGDPPRTVRLRRRHRQLQCRPDGRRGLPGDGGAARERPEPGCAVRLHTVAADRRQGLGDLHQGRRRRATSTSPPAPSSTPRRRPTARSSSRPTSTTRWRDRHRDGHRHRGHDRVPGGGRAQLRCRASDLPAVQQERDQGQRHRLHQGRAHRLGHQRAHARGVAAGAAHVRRRLHRPGLHDRPRRARLHLRPLRRRRVRRDPARRRADRRDVPLRCRCRRQRRRRRHPQPRAWAAS